jgi:hypothetical protein
VSSATGLPLREITKLSPRYSTLLRILPDCRRSCIDVMMCMLGWLMAQTDEPETRQWSA